jgi:hypothetical protein
MTTITNQTNSFNQFKKIDTLISLVLIGVFAILAIIGAEMAFAFYFVVGAWHTISMLAHFIAVRFNKKMVLNKTRGIYHWFVLFLGLLVFMGNGLEPMAMFLLLATPLMAIIYTIMCLAETEF